MREYQAETPEGEEFPEADDYEILDGALDSEDSSSLSPASPKPNVPSTPSSWTDVSSTAPTTPASGFQFGLDLDATSPRPETGSTRLKTPLTIPEWREECDKLTSAGTQASPRDPFNQREGADAVQVSGPWHRRWVPPAKGLRASPKRWFPLQSRFDLPVEAQQMLATGKLAGRPYAEKMQKLKMGDTSEEAKATEEHADPQTPRWMHDMYMSPRELHERLRKGMDLIRSNPSEDLLSKARQLQAPPNSMQHTPRDQKTTRNSTLTPRSPHTPRGNPRSRGLDSRESATSVTSTQAAPTNPGPATVSSVSPSQRPATSGSGRKFYKDTSPEGRWESMILDGQRRAKQGFHDANQLMVAPAAKDRPDLSRASSGALSRQSSRQSNTSNTPLLTYEQAIQEKTPLPATNGWIPPLVVLDRHPRPSEHQQTPGLTPARPHTSGVWYPHLRVLPSPRPTTTTGPYPSPAKPNSKVERSPKSARIIRRLSGSLFAGNQEAAQPREPQQVALSSPDHRSLTHRPSASKKMWESPRTHPRSSRSARPGRGWAFDDEKEWNIEEAESDEPRQLPPTENGLLLAKLCLAIHTAKGAVAVAAKAKETVNRLFEGAATAMILKRTGHNTVCGYEGSSLTSQDADVSLTENGIVASALLQKRTLKVDLYREPGTVTNEDGMLGIERVGVVFASPLSTSSRDGPTETFGVLVVQKPFGLFDLEDLEILTCLQEHIRAAMLRQGEGAGGSSFHSAKRQPAIRNTPVISGASAMNSRPPVA